MELINKFFFKKNVFYVFGGRPGMGLPRFTIKLANELAEKNKVLITSYNLSEIFGYELN